MRINRLEISDLRVIERLSLAPTAGLNLILGSNGAGKTSILEAIYLGGRGRTFRHSEAGPMIRRGAESTFVLMDLSDDQGMQVARLGVRRERQRLTCRLNGEDVKRRSELAEALPLQWIGSQPQLLLDLGPEVRRRFLDMGLFHVEPSYLEVAARFQRALRQRNAALRQGHPDSVRQWHQPLGSAAEALSRLRANYVRRMLPRAAELLSRWRSDFEFSYRYRRGWAKDEDLEDLLAAKLDQDIRLGYTTSGPQRADLELTAERGRVEKTLSRGQQKLLVLALNLATMDQIIIERGVSPVLLIDDLAAELDGQNRDRIVTELEARGTQAFLTMIEPAALRPNQSATMFHVEHGKLL